MPQRCIVAMNRGVTKRSNGPLADAAVAETNAPTEDRSPQVPRSAIFTCRPISLTYEFETPTIATLYLRDFEVGFFDLDQIRGPRAQASVDDPRFDCTRVTTADEGNRMRG